VGLLVAALFGGQHTSNITSTWVLMMIHSPKNRESLLPRLLKEQEEVLGRHGGEVTFDALQDMTLLENCIKETLRIFPPLIVSKLA
jgi:sterol 14-demethylase